MADFERFRGDDWFLAATISVTLDGVKSILDLTGATLVSTIGSWTGTPVVINAATGKCEVQVPKAASALFKLGTLDGDIQIDKSSIRGTVAFRLLVKPDQTIA